MTTSSAPDPPPEELSAEPVFAEPWQAQVFALTVELHRRGAFTWPEWSAALGARRAGATAADDGGAYYADWLRALEDLVARKALADPADLAALRDAWERAYRETPHGAPVVLGR